MVDEKPDLHGPVKVARGQGFIRAPPEEVLNMLLAVERRPDWDDLCDYASRVRVPPPPSPLPAAACCAVLENTPPSPSVARGTHPSVQGALARNDCCLVPFAGEKTRGELGHCVPFIPGQTRRVRA